ncbi:RICIN domain-containing protein [Streptomyces murinus]|uniref:RICIN domain-containing protein n=1 Tax=Streptomyces murinus TaxID=33900 RepID=UPI00287325C1|nr:RICIN domain-containing protein [Streptomyces murinus]
MLNPDSGKCLDDPNRSATAGTRLRIWGCNGTNAQRWHLPWPGADTAGGPDRAAPPPRAKANSAGRTSGLSGVTFTFTGAGAGVRQGGAVHRWTAPPVPSGGQYRWM